MSREITVATVAELTESKRKVVHFEDLNVALFQIDGVCYAIDNVCPHMSGPLAEGPLKGSLLTCPWHGWTFDVITGQCPSIPFARLKTFPVNVEDEELKLVLD